jgi:hypothetical protein
MRRDRVGTIGERADVYVAAIDVSGDQMRIVGASEGETGHPP